MLKFSWSCQKCEDVLGISAVLFFQIISPLFDQKDPNNIQTLGVNHQPESSMIYFFGLSAILLGTFAQQTTQILHPKTMDAIQLMITTDECHEILQITLDNAATQERKTLRILQQHREELQESISASDPASEKIYELMLYRDSAAYSRIQKAIITFPNLSQKTFWPN